MEERKLSTERGRFAPSPTGELHLGNARTALLAWLWTRSERGRFALRVEDLDRPRVRPGLAQQQLDELRWLGLDWDDGPTYQSERSALYDDAKALQFEKFPVGACLLHQEQLEGCLGPFKGVSFVLQLCDSLEEPFDLRRVLSKIHSVC